MTKARSAVNKGTSIREAALQFWFSQIYPWWEGEWPSFEWCNQWHSNVPQQQWGRGTGSVSSGLCLAGLSQITQASSDTSEKASCAKGNNCSSNQWMVGVFCSRHPNLTLRAPAPLSKAHAAASDPTILDRYFDLLEDVLEKNDLLGEACQIFSMDGTGMPLDGGHVKIVAQKSDRNPTAPSSGDKI